MDKINLLHYKASQTGPEKGTVSLLACTLVHEWHSMVVGLVTGLAGVWNPESYGWVTGLGKVRTMDIRGRKN